VISQKTTGRRKAAPAERLSDIVTNRCRVAAIGPVGGALAALETLAPASTIQLGYADLCPSVLAAHLPDLILTPLIGPGFDVLDLGARLRSLGFAGRIRAVAPPLPDAATVGDEVRHRLKGMDFALIAAEA